MSLIAPESEAFLDSYFRSKRMAESFKASLYGQDLSKWPARTVDAFDVIEIEAARAEQALSAPAGSDED